MSNTVWLESILKFSIYIIITLRWIRFPVYEHTNFSGFNLALAAKSHPPNPTKKKRNYISPDSICLFLFSWAQGVDHVIFLPALQINTTTNMKVGFKNLTGHGECLDFLGMLLWWDSLAILHPILHLQSNNRNLHLEDTENRFWREVSKCNGFAHHPASFLWHWWATPPIVFLLCYKNITFQIKQHRDSVLWTSVFSHLPTIPK